MLGCWKDRMTEYIRCKKEERDSSLFSLLGKTLSRYVSLTSFCVLNLGLLIYFVFNTAGLFENFFKTGPLIDGLVAGAVIGFILQRISRENEEDNAEEDEELAKQKAAEALGYIDYRYSRV